MTTDVLTLNVDQVGSGTGREVLRGLLAMARHAFAAPPPGIEGRSPAMYALSGRVRGTGPGVSLSALIDVLERDHPVELTFPFEGSDRVGGASWRAAELVDPNDDAAVAKLHWRAGAGDLPMHSHPHSDRFIIVLEGRGFFHVSQQRLDTFDGDDVRTLAAREGDVFMFTRRIVHTFSTAEHGMTLISCHLPYIAFDDPQQYALPDFRWTAQNCLVGHGARITAGGWAVLAE